MRRVNGLSMRSGTLGTASMGFALPLVLDPDIKLINAGQANPWRLLSASKMTTSNTYNSITSSGATAAWLGEGAVSSRQHAGVGSAADHAVQDGVVAVRVLRVGRLDSAGVDGDVAFASQVNGLLADAKDRLEEATFFDRRVRCGEHTGRSAVGDRHRVRHHAGTGAWIGYGAGSIAAIKEAVPPRWRFGPGAKSAGSRPSTTSTSSVGASVQRFAVAAGRPVRAVARTLGAPLPVVDHGDRDRCRHPCR